MLSLVWLLATAHIAGVGPVHVAGAGPSVQVTGTRSSVHVAGAGPVHVAEDVGTGCVFCIICSQKCNMG